MRISAKALSVLALALLLLAAPLGTAFAQDDTTATLIGSVMYIFCCLVVLIVDIALAIWTKKDADKRGANGTLWAVLVFFFGLVALVIYLLTRPKQ